jgi:hypothetical protein
MASRQLHPVQSPEPQILGSLSIKIILTLKKSGFLQDSNLFFHGRVSRLRSRLRQLVGIVVYRVCRVDPCILYGPEPMLSSSI